MFSLATGIPFFSLLFKGLPALSAPGWAYAATIAVCSPLKTWPAPACANPVMAEIVPPRSRNLVFAFDRCFEVRGKRRW